MAAKTSKIYQFKITLQHIKPAIWRRIQVPGKYNFGNLHLAIQSAMGWQNYHLHQFEIINPNTGRKDIITSPDEEEFDSCFGQPRPILENKAKIAKYFLSPKDKAIYEYDFGDGWSHEIVLEKILPAVTGISYPQCLDGKRACPPEDCGGTAGYENHLKIIADPDHKQYKEHMEWLQIVGGNSNPEEFNPKLIYFGKTSNVYQFKITLQHIKPAIWRRIQVPGKYNFGNLHLAIQSAMGWQNYHLHQFEIINPNTGRKDIITSPDEEEFDSLFGEPRPILENKAKIAKYFISPKDKAIYEYDFGDGWSHEIVLEKILPAVTGISYPQCLDGKRACPPEDCGGTAGYENHLKIIADPDHKEYTEHMEWLQKVDGNSNPEEFNPKLVYFAKKLNIYQFKITLQHIKPAIWRRIQVPGKYNFGNLHLAIQSAMGWQNYHLHQFEIINPNTGRKDIITSPDEEEFDSCFGEPRPILENKAKIAKYFLSPKDKAIYEYDFGDGWSHEIVLEKILPAVTGISYPQCLDGKRACPPEDCGGTAGYENHLKIIVDPDHKEYMEHIEWLQKVDGNSNPEEFNPKLIYFGNM